MSRLAILGGAPVIDRELAAYAAMGEAEVEAACAVVRSGRLSGFFGSAGPEYLGGPRVRAFEAAWAAEVGSRHAVSVNSATSGLIAAMGAIGLSPGDEVILPPTTMSATAMAPLVYGGIPVFADIEPATFCLDTGVVEAGITSRTRAILAVNLFGHPAPLARLRGLADRRGLMLVEDSAQAPAAAENGRRCGTVGHIGVYTLNWHKHIHTGEGGMVVTDDDKIAERLRRIRNHGENVVGHGDDLANMVGFNFRLTELQAAIGSVQLRDLARHVERRRRLARALTDGLADLDGITVPTTRPGCTHDHYVWAARYDAGRVGVVRATFARALDAEGFPNAVGYVPPLYRLPLFRKRVAIGRDGWPFTLTNRTYDDGLCPVAERLHDQLILFEPCRWDADAAMAERLVESFRKVHAHRDELRAVGGNG
ncbi:MAG: DegT/DnrJ/EryC1/StrS family aminotransferase [Alphaproteobacteria bacterium]